MKLTSMILSAAATANVVLASSAPGDISDCFEELVKDENLFKIKCDTGVAEAMSQTESSFATPEGFCEDISTTMETYEDLVYETDKCFRSMVAVMDTISACSEIKVWFSEPLFPKPEVICASLDCEEECKTAATAAVTSAQAKANEDAAGSASATPVSSLAVVIAALAVTII